MSMEDEASEEAARLRERKNQEQSSIRSSEQATREWLDAVKSNAREFAEIASRRKLRSDGRKGLKRYWVVRLPTTYWESESQWNIHQIAVFTDGSLKSYRWGGAPGYVGANFEKFRALETSADLASADVVRRTFVNTLAIAESKSN